MISLFATGDFVRADIKEEWYELGRVCLIMGFTLIPSQTESSSTLYAIVCGEEGKIGLVAVNDLSADYIYDVETDRFVDRSAVERKDDVLGSDDPMIEE